MPVYVRVVGAERYRDLSKALKAQGRGDLQRKLRSNIRAAGQPALADLRSAVRSVRVTSDRGGNVRPDRSTQLRQRVAQSMTIRVGLRGIRIVADAKRVGDHGVTLPRYLDADLRKYARWRHPVFGRMTSEWMQQTGQPWFFVTIRRHRTAFRRAVFAAMDETIREIS